MAYRTRLFIDFWNFSDEALGHIGRQLELARRRRVRDRLRELETEDQAAR